MAANPTPAKKATRKHRSPSLRAVDTIVEMPLGELSRCADTLVARDEETARFFCSKLQAALNPAKVDQSWPRDAKIEQASE